MSQAEGGPETVVDPVEGDPHVVTTEPDPQGPPQDLPVVTAEVDDEPADATEGDVILSDGGRTDNAGEVGEPKQDQDPDVIVESDPDLPPDEE